MADENRVPLFIRIPPGLKDEATQAAWMTKVSLSRFAESAIRDKIKQLKEPLDAEA